MSASPVFPVNLPSDDLCPTLGYSQIPHTETISAVHKALFASHDILHALRHDEQVSDFEDDFEFDFLDIDALNDNENSHFPYPPCKSGYYSTSEGNPYDQNEEYDFQTDERWLQFYTAANNENEWRSAPKPKTNRSTNTLHDKDFCLHEHMAQDKGKGKEKERTFKPRSPFAPTLDNDSKADRTLTFEKYSMNDKTLADLLSSFRRRETFEATSHPHYVIAGPSRIKMDDLVWY